MTELNTTPTDSVETPEILDSVKCHRCGGQGSGSGVYSINTTKCATCGGTGKAPIFVYRLVTP